MKRLIPFLLALLTLCTLLLSCGGSQEPPATAEEVSAAAVALLDRSLLVNSIFLGEGIPTSGEAFDGYMYADTEYCREMGVESVAELCLLAAEVYTPEVQDILYRKALTTTEDTLADYRDLAVGRGLYVLSTREAWYKDTVHEYLTDTLLVTAIQKDTATVTVRVRITPEGKTPQERTLTLPLVRGEDGWRCDKLTCISYDDDLNEQ